MKAIKTKLEDQLYVIGVVFILISASFFAYPLLANDKGPIYSEMFFLNYVAAVGYFVVMLISGRLRKGRQGLYAMFLFLILALISDYSLNREMNVFEETVPWFSVLLVILSVNYILFHFFEEMPRFVKHLMVALLGVAIIAFGYLAIYLMPYYIIGIIASPIIGLSLHVFVPLLLVLYTIRLLRRISKENKTYIRTFLGAGAVVTGFIIVFLIQWYQVVHTINKDYRKASVATTNGIPLWVSVASHASHGWITQRALKAGLAYTSAPDEVFDADLFWRIPRRQFWETQKHDPLVFMATLFGGHIHLDQEERIKVLESMYDSRHYAQERLWSGDDLFTEHINTAVNIWPQFGMSYTEKTVTVTNEGKDRWGASQQEGIYTFHLPEGAVITALSLWIEGQESKGILTTKAKADTAYKTIVGIETRDPSVVHWQEGNTVSVRVFPVVSGKSRKFKLGITAPLIKQNSKLVYGNIWFDGPNPTGAKEDVQLSIVQSPKDIVVPATFESKSAQNWKSTGLYKADWKIELGEQPLSIEAFVFDGKSYKVRPYAPQREKTSFRKVYLDINKSWSQGEFEMIWDLLKNKEVYAYQEGLVQLTDQNREEVFDQLQQLEFSLFPVYKIEDQSNALFISKTPDASPNLNDLKESRFMKQLQDYLTTKPNIKLYNIGNELSPYLKSLREYRLFTYEQGTPDQLKELLNKEQFATNQENDHQVIIHDAAMAIVQTEDSTLANTPTVPTVITPGVYHAPDHLMRLFSYNHIMQRTGTRLLTDQPEEDEVVQEAAKAYVVTPVSSLVVLESKKDYDKFEIKDSQNSLHNASIHGKGAVPEPHEWALIIIAAILILTVVGRPKLKKQRI